jgi:4-oxalocrotonate tautomerase
MPIMHVFMLEGRTDEQKEAFIQEVTEAAVRTVGAAPESVRIMITDMPKQNFGIAGQSARARGR